MGLALCFLGEGTRPLHEDTGAPLGQEDTKLMELKRQIKAKNKILTSIILIYWKTVNCKQIFFDKRCLKKIKTKTVEILKPIKTKTLGKVLKNAELF